VSHIAQLSFDYHHSQILWQRYGSRGSSSRRRQQRIVEIRSEITVACLLQKRQLSSSSSFHNHSKYVQLTVLKLTFPAGNMTVEWGWPRNVCGLTCSSRDTFPRCECWPQPDDENQIFENSTPSSVEARDRKKKLSLLSRGRRLAFGSVCQPPRSPATHQRARHGIKANRTEIDQDLIGQTVIGDKMRWNDVAV
jgi:hypothetical protein